MNLLLLLIIMVALGGVKKGEADLDDSEDGTPPPVDTVEQPTVQKKYYPTLGPALMLDSTNPVEVKSMSDSNKYYLGFASDKHKIAGVPEGTLGVWRGSQFGFGMYSEAYNSERYY